MSKKDWRKYEEYIRESLKEWADGEAKVKLDQKLPELSGVPRQVDALVTGRFAGNVEQDITAAVDCKRYSRKVHVKHVQAFIGLVEDVQTDLGLLLTNKGFTEAAMNRARRGIKLHVVPPVYVADIDELPDFYSPSYDEAYYAGDYFDHSPYGPVGAAISYLRRRRRVHARPQRGARLVGGVARVGDQQRSELGKPQAAASMCSGRASPPPEPRADAR